MKKLIVLCLAVLAMFTACAREEKEERIPTTDGLVTKEDESITSSDAVTEEKETEMEEIYEESNLTVTTMEKHYRDVVVELPHIEGLLNKKIETKINEDISKKTRELCEEMGEINFSTYVLNANFANVLSISIYVGSEEDAKQLYLNYNLVDGEYIKFEDLFSEDADTVEIVRNAFYDSLILSDMEAEISENKFYKIVKSYLEREDKRFAFTPDSLYLYEQDYVAYVNMEEIADSVAIDSKYLTKDSIYENDKKEEKVSDEPLFTLEEYPKVDASLAIHPLVDAIAANFLGKDIGDLHFEYTTTRSSEVHRNLIDGNVDVIFAAEISEKELEYAKEKGVELHIIPVTSSAFVFIVNKENPVNGLSFEQIQNIYTGKIKRWSEVGGKDEEIIAYQRPEGSGSQTAMLSLVMKDKKIKKPELTQVQGEMGELIDAVAEYDNAQKAIGYSYFYYVNTMYKRDTIKILEVDGIAPTIETIKNGEYPIFTNGFIMTRANEKNKVVDKWVEAVLSERGSKIIEEAGYVPVNE